MEHVGLLYNSKNLLVLDTDSEGPCLIIKVIAVNFRNNYASSFPRVGASKQLRHSTIISHRKLWRFSGSQDWMINRRLADFVVVDVYWAEKYECAYAQK
ncbi:hypothetical protein Tco_0972834 [Tanacetum coccineum]